MHTLCYVGCVCSMFFNTIFECESLIAKCCVWYIFLITCMFTMSHNSHHSLLHLSPGKVFICNSHDSSCWPSLQLIGKRVGCHGTQNYSKTRLLCYVTSLIVLPMKVSDRIQQWAKSKIISIL